MADSQVGIYRACTRIDGTVPRFAALRCCNERRKLEDQLTSQEDELTGSEVATDAAARAFRQEVAQLSGQARYLQRLLRAGPPQEDTVQGCISGLASRLTTEYQRCATEAAELRRRLQQLRVEADDVRQHADQATREASNYSAQLAALGKVRAFTESEAQQGGPKSRHEREKQEVARLLRESAACSIARREAEQLRAVERRLHQEQVEGLQRSLAEARAVAAEVEARLTRPRGRPLILGGRGPGPEAGEPGGDEALADFEGKVVAERREVARVVKERRQQAKELLQACAAAGEGVANLLALFSESGAKTVPQPWVLRDAMGRNAEPDTGMVVSSDGKPLDGVTCQIWVSSLSTGLEQLQKHLEACGVGK